MGELLFVRDNIFHFCFVCDGGYPVQLSFQVWLFLFEKQNVFKKRLNRQQLITFI